jgi:hypothetical protein
LALITGGCSGGPAPQPAASDSATEQDPPPFTRETLGGSLYAPGNANVAWAYAFPGEAHTAPEVALGPDGELIVLAEIERRPKPAAKLLDDFMLMRLDAASGELLWLDRLDANASLALDAQGNIILAQTTRLEKRAPDGTVLWSQARTPEHNHELVNVAVDADDHIVLARLELDEDPNDEEADPVGYVELDKLDPDGNPEWSQSFGDGTTYLQETFVTTDGDNDVILLAAGLEGPFDFGGGALQTDDVLAKYDPSGNYLFQTGLGGYGPTYFPGNSPVQTDAAGNIYLRTEDVGDEDTDPLSCIRDFYKYDAMGTRVWKKCIDTDNFATLPDGSFLTASTLHYDITVGNVKCTVLNGDAFGSETMLARYDAEGNWVATECAAEPGYQVGGNVVPDPSGMFFMTASYNQELTLPDGSILQPVDDYYTYVVAKVNVDR